MIKTCIASNTSHLLGTDYNSRVWTSWGWPDASARAVNAAAEWRRGGNRSDPDSPVLPRVHCTPGRQAATTLHWQIGWSKSPNPSTYDSFSANLHALHVCWLLFWHYKSVHGLACGGLSSNLLSKRAVTWEYDQTVTASTSPRPVKVKTKEIDVSISERTELYKNDL